MRVVVLGSRGQLACELQRARWPAGTEVVAAGTAQIDLARPATLAPLLAATRPDVVINAAAYTAVDQAESEPGIAHAVNRDGPAHLADLCQRRRIPLLHLSTDYVFDGTKPAAYREDDPVCPINVYGASKAAGEEAVRAGTHRHVIVRTAWVYSAVGHNFVKTMLRLGRQRDEIGVVNDQWGNPTAAADLAAALVTVAGRVAGQEDAPWGTYHFAGTGATTWHGLAEALFCHLLRETGRRPKLHALTTAQYPTPARRPANSRLACSRFGQVFGLTAPPWQESLTPVLAELLADLLPSG